MVVGVTSTTEPASATPAAEAGTEPSAARSASTGVNATLRILDLLAARGPVGLADLARELGVAKSTAHRVCAVLVERAWAVRDSDGRYHLGVRALRLGSVATELPIVVAFRSVASDYLSALDESIALAVLDGDESLYIAIEDTSQPVRYITHVGSKTPAFASASGRVVLANLPPGMVESLFAGRPLITPTGRRLGGMAELGAILDDVRKNGYAENWEETARGLYASSVPIVNDAGTTLAALTTLVPLSRATTERREVILVELQAAGRKLSELAAWIPAFSFRRP